MWPDEDGGWTGLDPVERNMAGGGSPAGGSVVSDWGDWFRDVSGDVVRTALGTYTYRNIIQPSGGIPAIGSDGRVYLEGQRYAYPRAGVGAGQVGGIGTGTLLIGAALLVGVLLIARG